MTWFLQNRLFDKNILSPYVFLQPPTEKTHQIIARTAKFVSEHGGQSEIVLRVKQGSNPVFGFLMPDHHLHVYFRFLVDHPEVLDADNKADRKHVEKGSVQGEGLSLLGSVYGTGDDEDEGTTQVSVDSKEGGSSIQDCSVDNTACSTDSGMVLEKAEFLIRKEFQEDISSTKQHTALEHDDASIIDRASDLEGSRHPSGDSLGTHASPSHELARNDTQSVQTSGNQVRKEIAPILEPPSFLKRVVEKMVEFIARNGKEFEGIIVNQDRVSGRFPFLLPTNQYHPYYLKVLEAAQQGKSHEKSSGSDKTSPTVVRPSGIQKCSQPKKMNNSAGDESLLAPHGSSSEDINPIHAKKTLDLDKKTKFKIVLGGSKKDGSDHGSGKPLGMTSEAAASAVRAATKMPANFRGLSQGTAEVKDNKKEGGMSADAAAAIVMAATRGSRRPQQGATSEAGTLRGGILHKILKGMSEESDGIGSAGASPGPDGDASHLNSSSGGMPFLQTGQNSGVSGSSSKFVVDGNLPCQQSGDISGPSGSILRLVDQNMPKDDASVAKVMVKAAALAAAREADSSEACLSREEKLKAERLKRAKVFAALIKNEQHVSEGENVQSTHEGAVSLQNESGSKATICGSSYNAASVPLGSSKGRISEVSARGEDCGQTEVRAASEDCNNRPSTKYLDKDRQSHSYRHRHRHHGDHHKRSKSQHDKSDDDCADDDDESRRRRHKHDSDKNHKHSSSDRHSRKRHYENSSLRSSEDGHKRSRHRSISRERDTGKRRDRRDSKEDGHQHRSKDNSSQKHTKKSYSDKEKSSKDNIKEKPAANSLKDVEVSAPEVSHSLSPSNASEVPDDLRAKVRAMLLANL